MPGKRSAPQPTSVHQLKVTLLGIRPPIWRRVAVPSDFTLGDLHHVIQCTMGWEQEHLHDFTIDKVMYADPDMLMDMADQNEWEATLVQALPEAKKKFRYLYDFGDSWEHELRVEKIGPPESEVRYPICLAGARACPPEDCGGVWGYADVLDAVADLENPDHEERLEWLGGPIDPEAFDRDEVNKQMWKYQR